MRSILAITILASAQEGNAKEIRDVDQLVDKTNAMRHDWLVDALFDRARGEYYRKHVGVDDTTLAKSIHRSFRQPAPVVSQRKQVKANTFSRIQDSLPGTALASACETQSMTSQMIQDSLPGTALASACKKKSMTRQILLSIEGNIGAGKSYLVENLKNKYLDCKDVHFLPEPVDEWEEIRDSDGKGMLEKFYGNQEKYAFTFQMMAYISRLAPLRKAVRDGYRVIISERSVFTDKMVFASMLHDDGKIEDVQNSIYRRWFHEFLQDMPPIAAVYIRTSPQVAKNRVDRRARKGESIPLAYLQSCHQYHDKWLLEDDPMNITSKIVLDGDVDVIDHPEQMDLWMEEIGKHLALDKC